MKEMKGPGTWEQWTHWKSRSETQKQRSATFLELEKLLATRQVEFHSAGTGLMMTH